MPEESMAPNHAEVNYQHMPDVDFRQQIADQMLATWLFNVRRLRTGKLTGDFKTWPELTDIEQNHYLHLSALALNIIWPEGR
ncbi:MAG: hypothetical protein GEV06_19675 [Luteitalea sp.]|nr:hypothetical protein [Luteitalea sp.]